MAMTSELSGKELLNTLAAHVAAGLSSLMERVFGPSIHTPMTGAASLADFGALICLVMAVLLVNGLVASFLRRKIREAEAEPESSSGRAQLWRTIGRPLFVLIWVYGGYFAAAPVLLKLSAPEGGNPAKAIFDKVFDLGVFVVVLWLGFRFTYVLQARLAAWAKTTTSRWDDLAVPLLGRTLRVIVPVVGLILVLPIIGLPPAYAGVISQTSSVLVVGAVAWILFHAVRLLEQAVLMRFDMTVADNLQARKVHTQIHLLSRTLYVLIGIFTVASVLMLFEEVRRFGTSILASAGVIGIIVGFAAQRTIANLFAGFQLAITQPIRIDDVVIVENEWGRIEEITLTYVVVKIWDDRRLIVPLSYFIEKPFQNWTRVSSELLGSVFVWADFALPVSELRLAVQEIVESSPDWDRRFWNLQVTDTTDRAMQLRVLATAADASKAWNLRCHVREKLLMLLHDHHSQRLPKLRAAIETAPGG